MVLRSRVLVAAGALGDLTAARHEWLAGVDAAITRSVGVHAAGAPSRVEECAAGLLTARPYAVQSLDRALRVAQPAWARLPVPVIVSLWAESAAEIATLAHEIAPLPNVVALELNLLSADGSAEGAALVARATESAAVAGLPVIVKLSPFGDLAACARSAASAGASLLDLGHCWPAVLADGSPAFVCGPTVAPQLAYALQQAIASVELPIVASGGVAMVAGARRLLDAGAAAVAIGAALLRDPSTAARIASELPPVVP